MMNEHNDDDPSDEIDDREVTPSRTFVNTSQRDDYVPEPDTNYRAGSMDYKSIQSRGLV